ncbi:MAG: hypothetical protein L0H53_13545 [Candidatus Nitrosocosmicus sp.]|nr:hypothetical protein [Candidatus Nitrosocosmicus sp.]MDN5868513.1 hypothetical protein [Candidatus Nitrosocosmicus sp.]
MQGEISFEQLYEQAVFEAFSILGTHISKIIILHIAEKYSIRVIDTANNPQALTEALKSTLDGGTRLLQRRILRILYEKMDIEPSFSLSINFEEKILEARNVFAKSNGKEERIG